MQRDRSKRQAFTLIELMMVVAIMGIVLAIGIPSIFHMLSKESMGAAVRDVMDVCRDARARAVLGGSTVELHIHPRDGRFDIVGGSGGAPKQAEVGNGPGTSVSAGHASGSVQISDRVLIEMCDVNFDEYRDAEEAVVKFFPNGTSDEFTLVLHGDKGEIRKITLEVVTALAECTVIRQ